MRLLSSALGGTALFLFVAVSFLAGLVRVQSPYYVIGPGATYDIAPRLRLPPERMQLMGNLAFTAVYVHPGSWSEVLQARFRNDLTIVPAEEVRPRGTSQEQVNDLNRRLIDESKTVAAVVALRAAGFEVHLSGQGAEIGAVVGGAPADGVLERGDVVVAVDGQPVETSAQLVEAVRRHVVGDVVYLRILRDGIEQDVTVGTRPSPTEPRRPMIGTSVKTRLFDVELPFPVAIDTDDLGGPSAGFMFALGLLDALTEGDLTRGYSVAGTGTIAADGSIGPVGGVREKTAAAERAGAHIFLVPRANADEVRASGRSTRIELVDGFADTVRFLCSLPPATVEVAGDLPAPCRTP